jgi:hypothetical protein
MRREIVITDLTRFRNPEIVCTAGIDRANGECIRPMPYLGAARCRELDIRPGTRLRGEFTPVAERVDPHSEDCTYERLGVARRATSREFRAALVGGLCESLTCGFGYPFRGDDRCLPINWNRPSRSLITLVPRKVEIVGDPAEPRIRLNVRDRTGHEVRFVPITDACFHGHALEHHAREDLAALNDWLHSQRDVLLRFGLSREYAAPDGRSGYWLQCNGIYTFPRPHPTLRCWA